MHEIQPKLLTWNFETSNEGIASISYVTATDRTVINCLASSIDATNSRARVDAFEVFASTVCCTL